MDVVLVQNSLEQALLWTRTFPHAVTARGALCHLCHTRDRGIRLLSGTGH